MHPRIDRRRAATQPDQDVSGVVIADSDHHVQKIAHADRRARGEVDIHRAAHAGIDVPRFQRDLLAQIQLAFIDQRQDVHRDRHFHRAGHREADPGFHCSRASTAQVQHVDPGRSVQVGHETLDFLLQRLASTGPGTGGKDCGAGQQKQRHDGDCCFRPTRQAHHAGIDSIHGIFLWPGGGRGPAR